jgi:hypothetical protein
MIHSSDYDPRVYPYGGKASSSQIDRVQEMTAAVTMNRTKINEVGRDGIVDWRKAIPGIALTIRQLEYGSLQFWKDLANAEDGDVTMNWTDYKTPQVDIVAYETDSDGTFKSTVWYPNLRVAGFGLNIGDPEALMERTFNLVGEDEITLQGTNKYLVVLQDESCIGASHTIIIGAGAWTNYPTPVADPDASGSSSYILKLLRITAAGVTSELELTTDYTYDNGTKTITIAGSVAGDTFKAYYGAGSYITASTPWTDNDIDAAGLTADYCSIYLETTNYVYRLQSVSVDVTFDRQDIKEIGNANVVARGIRNINTKITLGRILDQWTVEELLRGVATAYPKINIRKYIDNINLIIKLYTDETKTTFLLGYAFTDLAPTGIDNGTPVNDYVTRGVSLEGESGLVTSDETVLNAL